MKSATYYIKSAVLAALLFLQSLVLSQSIYNYTIESDIFKLSFPFYILVGSTFLALMLTSALTIGAWNKYEQYIIILGPVLLGLLLGSDPKNILTLLPALSAITVIMVYNIYISNRLRLNFIKLDPKATTRFICRGIIFSFSLWAGFLMLLNAKSIDIGAKLEPIIQEPVNNILQNQLETAPLLQGFNIGTFVPKDFLNSQIDTSSMINGWIKPYQSFIVPVLGVALFALISTIGAITMVIFLTTVDSLYWLAKKTHFLKVTPVQVEKQELNF